MSLKGIRVLRGPDWSGEDVDGGDGHLGTVINASGTETVDVLWDNGKHSTCRVGQNGKYDLKTFDNGTIGVRHTQVVCSCCSERGIFGMRWSCSECKDVNLCSLCYVSDKHDIHHEFIRYDTLEAKGTRVSKRASAVKCQAMGIIPGATVKRGKDWKWGNQDGGDGKLGEVISIEDNNSSSARNIVRVCWKSSDGTYVYCLGDSDGNMNLEFAEISSNNRGTYYYREHLPVCTMDVKVKLVMSNTTIQTNSEVLKDGDKVCIMVSSDTLEELQKQHSTFTTGMLSCIGKTGEVKGFATNGDAMIEFDDMNFSFYPGTLKKIHCINVGDTVCILPDEDKVRLLQENHGPYEPQMKTYLGKVGQVVKKDSEGDVVVKFGLKIYVYNPACCTPAPGKMCYEGGNDTADDDTGDTDGSQTRLDLYDLNKAMLFMMGGVLFGNLCITTLSTLLSTILDADAADANIGSHPLLAFMINVSSYQGNRENVLALLQIGVDINNRDISSNTPLMAAIYGKQEAIVNLLIDKGADVKPANTNRQTALYFAAFNNYGDLITVLIQKGCDCNSQDAAGNTALHFAIIAGSDTSIDALCCAPNLDVTVVDKGGFNTLQLAALYGSDLVTEKILERNKSVVDENKLDGATALHIAAINNHTGVARILILKGNADVNCKNGINQSPLHLAAQCGMLEITKLLVENKADVNLLDITRSTPLHLALLCDRMFKQLYVYLQGISLHSMRENKIKIACYLIQHGARLDMNNAIGETPMDFCSDEEIKTAVKNYILQNNYQSK